MPEQPDIEKFVADVEAYVASVNANREVTAEAVMRATAAMRHLAETFQKFGPTAERLNASMASIVEAARRLEEDEDAED